MHREKVFPIIQELMNRKNNAFLTGSISQLDTLFTGDTAAEKCLERERKIFKAKMRALNQRGSKIYDHSTQIFLGPDIRAGNMIKFNFAELVAWRVLESGRLRYERQQINHEMILEYQNQWLIKEDDYRLEPKVATIPRPLERHVKNNESAHYNGTSVYRNQRYDRTAAVRYAHKWWNSYNPNFRSFSVDCTNYVSQVLYAGGIPMNYTGKTNTGWWYSGNGGKEDKWSYSWAVAHSLRWYLAEGKGIHVENAKSARELMPGDIICYDWDGDGVWQHNTVVVGHNGAGEPLINAHTNNSQNRFWDYQDSVAWTEKTQYLFWKILS
ncbi:MAG: amidase domain-containing protein [Dehalobacterium sp.]